LIAEDSGDAAKKYKEKDVALNNLRTPPTSPSLHFTADDFVEERRDCNATRRKRQASATLAQRYLKYDAVPSKLPEASIYLSYFISTRQVIGSDGNIRALSLVKFSAFSPADIDAAVAHRRLWTHSRQHRGRATLRQRTVCSDSNVLYYVNGYTARSVIRTTKREHCREVLVTSDPLEPIQLDESLDYKCFSAA